MSEFLTRISQYSPKRLALLADELKGRVDALEHAAHEPIAVIGIGCRLPGGVHSADELWGLVSDGVDAIREVPADRWDVDALFDPDPDAPGRMSTRWGGFIDDVDAFDAGFFGIARREAQSMDPQQRLVLEVAWRALEDAGIDPDRLEGSATSVYLGISASDYYQAIRDGGPSRLDAYTASGVAHSIASGRLSYVLGLCGPSVSIDTACSSSLVAIHQAVNSLRRGESSLALAGGANLILGPDISIALSKAHMMSPDGRCKAFDARADGFVRGEGCGILVLKRLRDARADGDRVLAVIRGSAANQDGRSNGLTAPNGPSQEAVVRDALADAGVDPAEVGYVEAHGTGTSLGDPIEVQALGAVLGPGRAADTPLLIGSVKANIGHLEAAAGVAAVIKLITALRHGRVPGQIHFDEPNPHIAWDELPIRVATSTTQWPAVQSGRAIGGVSSFGFSGTNVHMVIEAAPRDENPPVPDHRDCHPFSLSARSGDALRQLAAAYRDYLGSAGASLADAAFTANAGRAHFAHRAVVVERTVEDAREQLDLLARGESGGIPTGIAPARTPRIAFLFSGQGAQFAGMSRSLYEQCPPYRAALERCARLLEPHLSRPLLPVLFPEPGSSSPIDETEFTQPAMFALEYALAELWMSWGIRPSVVAGHSVGEVVAACLAGVFSLEDALALIAARGRLMGALPKEGSMYAVRAPESVVAPRIAAAAGEVSIAALNGPDNTVISGRAERVQALVDAFAAEGLECTRLKVSHAFHSPLMEPMLAEFRQVLEGIGFSAPRLDLISNVTGERIGAEVAQPDYWLRQVMSPVRFGPGIEAAAAAGCTIFVEAGPGATLLAMGRSCVESDSIAWLPSLRADRSDWLQMTESLSELYLRGAPVDWKAFHAPFPKRLAPLPGYPFERERLWVERSAPPPAAPALAVKELHPLLGHEISHSLGDARLFETQLSLAALPYLADHRIFGALLLPSPALMEMALAAAAEVSGTADCGLEDFTVHQPLRVDEETATRVQLVAEPLREGVAEFRIASYDESAGAWRRHATGRVVTVDRSPPAEDVDAIGERTPTTISVDEYYDWLASLGLEFGPRFRHAESIARRDGEVLARVSVPPAFASDSAYRLHPAVLDACLHMIGAALPDSGRSLRDPFMLLNVGQIACHRPLPASFWVQVEVPGGTGKDPDALETFGAQLRLLDDAGTVLAELRDMHLKRAPRDSLPAFDSRLRNLLYAVHWRESPAERAPLPSPRAVAADLLPRLLDLAGRNRLDDYADFQSGLDALAATYVVEALASLGFALVPGESFETAELAAALDVPERHRRLFARMLEMLAEDGLLLGDRDRWQVAAEAEATDSASVREKLSQQYPEGAAELTLTSRCGERLADVIRGQVDPLGLLFPGGSLGDAEALYRDSMPARTYNEMLAEVVAEARGMATAERPLRILEIGAGTGSTTSFVLEQLADLPAGRVRYCFTDVSPLFLNRAAEKFADRPGMEFRTLDIAADPAEQSFDGQSFDVIIAANVLHATPDLDDTLAHVRSLLRPGGWLLLLEGTTPQRFGDLTVGLLDGWWAYADLERRSYALMNRSAWLDLLHSQGFEQAITLPGDDAGPVLSQQAILLARAPAGPEAGGGRWLILPDDTGLAERVSQRLEALGHRPEIIAADRPEALDAALREPAAGVVCLSARRSALDCAIDPVTLLEDQQQFVGQALALVQGLAAGGGRQGPLWIVTRGAQAVAASESADPSRATAWGLGHVVALEHPELGCRRIDLDPDEDLDACADALVAALCAPDREDQLAVRGGKRLVRRLVRQAAAVEGDLPLRPDCSYLVTGGLTGLGLVVAEWLAAQGARYLVLAGRRAPDAHANEVIDRLRDGGAKVLVGQCDIGRRADVERLLAETAQAMPRLAGIIHSAGVLDDGVLTAQSWERFAKVMHPKVSGSWHLHQLARDLDFLVLFSSGASLAGSPGQANHAAANAFEDALAWYRQARGLPTLSINWGPWSRIGAAAERAVDVHGLAPIEPEDGLAALGALMRTGAPGRLFHSAQAPVLATDWSHLARGSSADRVAPFFDELATEARRRLPASEPSAVPASPEPTLLDRLAAAPANRRRNLLREFVRRQTAGVLGARRPEDLDFDEPLRELGLDSLMAVELRNKLGSATQRTLPATITFDYPSISALVEYIAAELFPPDAQPPETATADETDASAALDALTQEELAERLSRRIERLGSLD